MATSTLPALAPLRHRTKTQAIAAQLLELAHRLGPDAKLPTVLQLCAQLGVSVTTLNTVLAELESQKAIYRRHGVGIFVSPQLHQKCVGLLCAPDFFRAGTSPFWQQLIEGVQSRAALQNEAFRFYLTIPSPQAVGADLSDDVEAGRVNGIVSVGNNTRAAHWLKERGTPVVSFAGEGDWNVRIDYGAWVRAAVEIMAQKGCRELGILMPIDSHDKATKKLSRTSRAFIDVLEERALPCHKEWIWDEGALSSESAPALETHQEQGYRAALQLFGTPQGKRPQALLITDDMMARGALVALQELGLRPGRDVQIVSHINRGSSVLQGYEKSLCFLEIDPADIVRALFEMLELLMNGDTPADSTTWVGLSHHRR